MSSRLVKSWKEWDAGIRSEKSMDDFYRNIGLDSEQLAQPGKTVTKKSGNTYGG